MFRVLALACVVVALVCSEEAGVGPGAAEKSGDVASPGVHFPSGRTGVCLLLLLRILLRNSIQYCMLYFFFFFLPFLLIHLYCPHFLDCVVNLGLKIDLQSSKMFPLKDITKFAVKKDKRRPESKFLVHLSDLHNTSLLSISIPLQLHDARWSNISLSLEGDALQVSGSSGNISWDVGVTSVEVTNVTGFRIETLPDNYLVLNECFEGEASRICHRLL